MPNFTYGFFDSSNGDRKYGTEEFNTLMSAIASQGVFISYKEGLRPTLTSSGITVGSGFASFNSRWVDVKSRFTVSSASSDSNRVDAVVIHVSNSDRSCSIKVISKDGTIPPVLANGPDNFDYPLAYVYYENGNKRLIDKRGSEDCPISHLNIEDSTHIAIDPTLSNQGEAADAKAAGTLIGKVYDKAKENGAAINSIAGRVSTAENNIVKNASNIINVENKANGLSNSVIQINSKLAIHDTKIQQNEVDIGNIQTKTLENIDEIEYNDKRINDLAPAYKKEVIGKAISVDDVSPVEHQIECKIESINKLNVKSVETFQRRIEVEAYLEPGEYKITWDSWAQYGEATEMRYPAIVFNRERAYALAGSSAGPNGGSKNVVINQLTRGVLIYSNDWSEPLSQNITATVTGLRITKLFSPSYTPYVIDLSKVKVSEYIGNIFDITTLTKAEKWRFDGSAYTGYLYRLYDAFKFSNGGISISSIKGLICTISATVKSPDSGGQVYVIVNYEDGTGDNLIFSDSTKYIKKTLTAKKPIDVISMSYKGSDGLTFIKDMCVSVGSTAIESKYTPPKELNPESNGIVNGMVSSFPSIGIVTNNPGAIVTAKYNPDTATKVNTPIAVQSFGSVVRDTMVGSSVITDMVSPVEHQVECNVERINLSKPIGETETVNGITFISNQDGSITVKGTATEEARHNCSEMQMRPNVAYHLRGCPKGGGDQTYYLEANGFWHDTGDGYYFKNSVSFKTGAVIVIKKGYMANDLIFKPIISLYKNKSYPYIPYVSDLSHVMVSRYGGNLFNKDYIQNASINSDGDIQISSSLGVFYEFPFPPNTQFTMQMIGKSDRPEAHVRLRFVYTDGTDNDFYTDGTDWKVYTLTSNSDKSVKNISITWGGSGGYFLIKDAKLMLTLGAEIKEWEPFISYTNFPNSDGNVLSMESVSPVMTILTDNPGVIVEATYNADTKKYIDKKFAELQAAILSTGGNV